MKVRVLKIFLIPLVSLTAGLSSASAGLVGTTANVNYEWPALGDVLFAGVPGVVEPGGTLFSLSSGAILVDVSDTSIDITFTSGWTFNTVTPKTFDGVVTTDNDVKITGISLTSTNISGYVASDVSFDNHDVAVNFPFPPFSSLPAGSTISLGVTSSAIPEASTWALMLVGFAGIGFAGWHTRRKIGATAL
jgi:hypothetical protein